MPVGDQAPFTDVRVRQALAYAVDRKSLVENVLLNSAVLDDSMFPPGIPGYHVPATTYAFDPDKARQLLREAGYDGTPVKLSTRADAVLASEITQALVGQLKDVGFSVSGEVLDTPVYEADCAKPRPKYLLHWNEFGWVTGGPFHMALGSIAGRAHYANRKYADLVAKVNSTADGPQRDQLIAEAIDQWALDAGWIVLWVPKRIDAGISQLQGYQPPSNVITLFGGAYLNGAS
jgi:peptide/nickel transport system substrate-binding protein